MHNQHGQPAGFKSTAFLASTAVIFIIKFSCFVNKLDPCVQLDNFRTCCRVHRHVGYSRIVTIRFLLHLRFKFNYEQDILF